ncbi:YbfB/YjiJ family MFS transporter [Pseudorhodoferax sp. Leaf274]|uniref:YbfB/YjiJ family MFS transporter n=1 Tax=Pseudorhodoferax sp. Leaf274 TaxID=1736318 RepID=UPI000702FA0F|nr:YbfB/YjiJ family MFS transporter [Pseudorhodoferax sp. Leaf274]KQP37197.1 MFS transporter [Pseudorhodoferax sp. Leaf274]
MPKATASPAPSELPTFAIAAALALAAAVSLGLSRFSYALLLPPMRADLGWSYTTAGAMNTVNAAGYLVGALLAPGWLRRYGARRALLAGGIGSAILLAAHGMVTGDAALYVLRALTGVASAATFVSGGLLAARLSGRAPRAGTVAPSPGLVLGIYYGGTGVGIVLSALLVPPLSAMPHPHAWHGAWIALGVAALVATAITAAATRTLDPAGAAPAGGSGFVWPRFAAGLASYFLFGLGYIGYMTFVVTLLREQHLGSVAITVFYALLGVAVLGSSFVWAGLLQRHRGGGAMRLLNALLAVATVLPVASAHPVAVFASGVLFGGVFLSVVASTTALVRHNLPAAAWPAGIAAFTIVFAAGQIVGPTLVGLVADGAGGLRGGLACSAAVLLLGAGIAWGQKPLANAAG